MPRRYWIAFAAIGLITIASLAGYAIRSSYNYHLDNEEDRAEIADNDASGGQHHLRTACRIVPLRLSLECTSEQESRDNEQGAAISDLKAQQDMSVWTYAMLWISGFMLIVTGLGVWYVARTLRATNHALEAANTANEQAKRAADAAEDTVDITRDMGKRQTRAYVCIEKMQIIDFKIGKQLNFKVTARNVGQTPAYNYRGWYAFKILPNYMRKRLKFRMGNPPTSQTVLGPGLSMSTKMEAFPPLTAKEVRTVEAGKCTLFIWGEELYTDIFGTEHYTRYRYELSGPEVKDGKGGMICSEGNEAT